MNTVQADAGLIPVDTALAALLSQVAKIEDTETVPIQQALGRYLANDQVAGIDVPGFDNSAMDGYALNLDELPSDDTLPVSQRCAAGDSADVKLDSGSCARIFTGAPIPAGANAVVMQEQCQVQEAETVVHVVFPDSIERGQNIRRTGQDIKKNSVVVKAGQRLRPHDLGLLASIGIAEVEVKRKMKVAIMATGDELIQPGHGLKPGQIYNSNHLMLMQLLEKYGFESMDAGTIPDDLDSIQSALKVAAEQADCVISCGGVSVGEADFVKTAVENLGQLDLWRIAIKPGKPFAFGSIEDTPFLGLPGNPSSSFVTFHVIALPYLMKAQTGITHQAHGFSALAAFSHRTTIREQFLYVQLKSDAEGRPCLHLHPQQNSGVLSTSTWATGLVRVPANTEVHMGDLVMYYPLA